MMKTPESAKFQPIEAKEKLSQYHFEEMTEMEPAVIEVVEQLKDAIEKGEYDALISDDAGGRIPTLILRKVFEKINPEKSVGTLFVAAGHALPNRPNYDHLDNPFYSESGQKPGVPRGRGLSEKQTLDHQKLLDYLKKFKVKNKTKKALVVTQFIRRGASMGGLLSALQEVGIRTDVAALEISFMDDARHYIPSTVKVFHAPKARLERKCKSLTVAEEHEKLSGVEKNKKSKTGYSPTPVPTRLRETPLSTYPEYVALKQQLEAKYYGDKYNEYTKRPSETNEEIEKQISEEISKMLYGPITPADILKMQRDINLARKDVELLAEKAISKVWGR